MTEQKAFPEVADLDHVYCFNCKLRVTGPFQSSGFATGHGSMRGQCTGQHGCGMITYFDVVEEQHSETVLCGVVWVTERDGSVHAIHGPEVKKVLDAKKE